MEIIRIDDFSFIYPNAKKLALDNIKMSIAEGEFVTVCGKSGCGKSTLLRNLKPDVSPHGIKKGRIFFKGTEAEMLSKKEQSTKIGFVMQSPENQIVTDKVWHELAFGLESIGMPAGEMRAKVAEMAAFFGIETWFHKMVSELSGGQKQLLNLASVMVLQPEVLVLDEPTSQLDPIAAGEFLATLKKINKELGTTVIITEHRLEEAFALSDRVIVLDDGKIIADDAPKNVGKSLKEMRHDMFFALPTAVRVAQSVPNNLFSPITVSEGHRWLLEFAKQKELCEVSIRDGEKQGGEIAVKLDDVWLKYGKDMPYVLRGMSLAVRCGEIYALMGGNGTGKTTALGAVSGILNTSRGKVSFFGTPADKCENKYNGLLGVLPQNPRSVFVRKTVVLDLAEMLSETKMSKDEKQKEVERVMRLCKIYGLKDSHPYDLSGGEQQRAALAKILLLKPRILLMDEPTKGFDAGFKERFADILDSLKKAGVAILMVSHDIEFCAKYADRCGLMFDGNVVSEGEPREFFAGKSFYTTAANRMARGILPNAVLAEDIIRACGEEPPQVQKNDTAEEYVMPKSEPPVKISKPENKLSAKKLVLGSIFAVLFLVTVLGFHNKFDSSLSNVVVQGAELVFLGISLNFFITARPHDDKKEAVQTPKEGRRLSKRTLLGLLTVLVAVPLTIYVGKYFLGDRKYYFISLLIILETLVPFFALFEKRKPQARELIIVSVICAITVAGRAAFYMIPQFKPVAAVVIITGVAFGGETGFLVGAITAFASNMFFGQGPWTPWQMFAFGIIGFIAGVLFKKGFLRKKKTSLCIFGGLASFFIYGVIMNSATVIMYQENPTLAMFVSSAVMGIPFDLIHSAATVFFLWFAAEPFLEKLDRIKTKYGIAEM